MELPKINRSGGGMFDGLKDRFGFSSKNDEADDYDEYGDEEYYDEQDQGYGSRAYDRNGGYDDRPYNDPHHPPLVSLDDVRTSTQVPDSLNRDPLSSRGGSVAPVNTDYRVGGTPERGQSFRKVERAADYMRSTPGGDYGASGSRSEGVDSLFSSTASQGQAVVPAPSNSVPVASTSASSAMPSSKGAYDPYDAYAGAGQSGYNPTRGISVVKPVSYGDVERVAKILKAGDAVVLGMRNTPENLAKRILDFSFGVSSALDASVDCVADKVFVITRGNALSDQEKQELRNQGVL